MSAQLENGYVRIANEIWDEIIRRDFTKRQKDILQFVIRLSYGCNKKSAHIPMMQDFGLCGVTKNHIKGELNYLKEMMVLNWSQDEMVFSFNKDYRVWQARPVRAWNSERFKELIHINLTSSQNRNDPVPKTGTNQFPKQEQYYLETPTPTKDEWSSKDSIKDSIKENQEEETAMSAYIFSFKKLQYTGHIQDYVKKLMDRGFADSFIREVFMEMGERGIGADVNYMKKVAEDWISRGITSRKESKEQREQSKTIDYGSKRSGKQSMDEFNAILDKAVGQ